MRRALLLVFIACGPSSTGAPPPRPPVVAAPPDAAPAEPVPDPAPPELRLPKTIKPLKHDVTLTLDPSASEFTGTITIDLEVAEATPVVWLHGSEITLKRVALGAGDKVLEARPIYPTKDFIGLVLASPLPAGRAKLTMEYTGKIHKDDGTGIYTAKEGDDWYAYTQFEATDAREAFPCFDEPSFKAPWKVAIKTRKALAAFANTPIVAEKDLGDHKLVEFAETKPLPSYLVAFAVGPFETVDAGKTRGGAPIRIVVPRGRTKDVAYPVEATRPILDLLEDYFGSPYPYEKLDMLACLVFNAGAMENPGLITWHHNILLTKPQDMTLGRQQLYASVASHELAHQWFGNYVTLAWWDDIWLNEAFATWAGEKIVDQWKPAWEGAVSAAADKDGVMGSDSLETARSVRNPIESQGDIDQAFDGITYQKGQAVLSMIERHVGADVFKTGVRSYLAKHAWGNATYDDFVGALATAATGKDVKPIFDAFILQSGVPLVSFDLQCKAGAPPALAIAQQRYVPTGSQMDPKRTWKLPVCVRWGTGNAKGTDCTMLTTETATLALTAKTCPDWVLPNAEVAGYYRMSPKGKLLDNLLAKAPKVLAVPEKVGLVGDVTALVGNGTIQQGVALTFVESMAKDKNRYLVDASIGVIAGIEEMVPDNLRPNYERLIKKHYRQRALDLGFKSRPGEDDNTKQLRPRLVGLVASSGNDKALIEQATALAWKWLDDHKAVEPEMVGVVLGIAAQHGDQKLFDRLRKDAKAATERSERGRLLGAMGAFKDPKIVAQAMAIAITDEFELREALALLQGGFAYPQTRNFAYELVTKNIDAITNKLPEPFRPYIAFTFVPLCDDTRKKEFEAFFKPRLDKIEGGAKTLAQALEALTLCSAQRKAQTPGVIAFLKRQ